VAVRVEVARPCSGILRRWRGDLQGNRLVLTGLWWSAGEKGGVENEAEWWAWPVGEWLGG
jgi:hypothetical protein